MEGDRSGWPWNANQDDNLSKYDVFYKIVKKSQFYRLPLLHVYKI